MPSKPNKMVSTSRIVVPLSNLTFSKFHNSFLQQKKREIRKNCLELIKHLFPLARMKNWLKNMLQLKEELIPLVAVDYCLKKWFPLARKSVSIS